MTVSEDQNTDRLYRTVLENALRFVSIRPRSRHELSRYVKKRIFALKKSEDRSVMEDVLTRLGELGYGNDADFCRWWISSRGKATIRGKHCIIRELLSKGVSREDIQSVLASFLSEDDEVEKACLIIRKMMRRYPGLSRSQLRLKFTARLMRRGFDRDIIKQSVEKMLESDYNTDGF